MGVKQARRFAAVALELNRTEEMFELEIPAGDIEDVMRAFKELGCHAGRSEIRSNQIVVQPQ